MKEKLDKLFEPDIRLELDENDIIIGYEVLSQAGNNYVLKHNLLEKKYDEVLKESNSICFETI